MYRWHKLGATFLLCLGSLLLSGSNSQQHCMVSNPEAVSDCLTLWTAFRESLVKRRENLQWLDLVFNPPSRQSPTLIKVVYTYNIVTDDCSVLNQRKVFGWTTQSLYVNFHPAIINQAQIQFPYFILEQLESESPEEPYFNDFSWIGDGRLRLPEVHLFLNITSLNDYGEVSCPSDNDVNKALGELNHWLKSFAMVAQKNDDQVIELADPAYKGYTLPSLAVKPITMEVFYDENLRVGIIIFIIVYLLSIFFVIYLTLIPMLTLKENMHRLLIINENENETPESFIINEDKTPVSESFNLVQLIVLFPLASFYILAIIGTDVFQLYLNRFNLFAILKLLLSPLIIIICFMYCCRCSCSCCPFYYNSKCNHPGWHRFLAATLLSFTYLLCLDMIPTILLSFIFPVESFALIIIHIALLYTETMFGTPIFHYFRRQIKESCRYKKSFWAVCSVFISMFMIFAYFSILFFFQLLILRNVNNNDIFSLMTDYLPSVVIIVFGITLNQGFFFNPEGVLNSCRKLQKLLSSK